MIRYHGGPITPEAAAIEAWRDGHACISFANPEQVELAFEKASSVMIDNGAFPLFTAGGGRVDVPAYLEFVSHWKKHPAFDWLLIPDIIDGTEGENDFLIHSWTLPPSISVPVWHMHESLGKLEWLVCAFPRVAIGSSGEFWDIDTGKWWQRIAEAMEIACDHEGFPKTKLHGLRQMDPAVFSRIPYSSVDSTNIGRNIGIDCNWTGSYVPKSKTTRARVMRDNISHHASSRRWPVNFGVQRNLELMG